MTEIARRPAGALAIGADQTTWNQDQLAALESLGIDRSVTSADLQVYLAFCQRVKLSPFHKQTYLLKFAGKWQPLTARDGLRVIAERTGAYRGATPLQWCGPDLQWTDVWISQDPPVAARAGIWRDGYAEPVTRVALWAERARYQSNGKLMPTWSQMPSLMLAKVAECDALRAAFPNDLGSVFSIDELGEPSVTKLAGRQVADMMSDAVAAEDVTTLHALWNEAGGVGAIDATVVDPDTAEVLSLRDYLTRKGQALSADRVEEPETAAASSDDPWSLPVKDAET